MGKCEEVWRSTTRRYDDLYLEMSEVRPRQTEREAG